MKTPEAVKRAGAMIMCLVAVVLMSACGPDSAIIGRWEENYDGLLTVYDFFGDGTGVRETTWWRGDRPTRYVDFTWSIEGSVIRIAVEEWGGQVTSYPFSIDGNVLRIPGRSLSGMFIRSSEPSGHPMHSQQQQSQDDYQTLPGLWPDDE